MRISVNPPKLVRWYMNWLGYVGLATVWDTIYFIDKTYMTSKNLRHEKKHLEQMKRDGKAWYLIKYHYYWIKYGYWNNPYEIEAREAEYQI